MHREKFLGSYIFLTPERSKLIEIFALVRYDSFNKASNLAQKYEFSPSSVSYLTNDRRASTMLVELLTSRHKSRNGSNVSDS